MLPDLLITLLCAEVLCRFEALGVPWKADSLGRRRTLNRRLPGSVRRVLCLGASHTFGARVKEARSYPSQLERLLKTQTERIHVLNAGISGHTSVQTLARVDRDALAFRPDVVVLWVGTNDGMLKSRPDPKSGARPFDAPPLATRSALLTTLDSLPPVMYLTSVLGRPSAAPQDLLPRVDLQEFSATYDRILKRLSAPSEARIVVLKIPRVPDHFKRAPEQLVVAQRKMHAEYNLVISRLCKRHSVPLITPDDFLKADCYLNDGLHLNREGNAPVARAVRDVLLSGPTPILSTTPEQDAATDADNPRH